MRNKEDPQTKLDKAFAEAVLENRMEEAERLLAEGADIMAEDSAGWPVIFAAASQAKPQPVLFLLDHGIDVNVTSKVSVFNPVSWDQLSPGDTLLQRVFKTSLQSLAIELVERGADVHKADGDGRTPLHHAAHCGWFDLTRVLIKKGADLFALDGEGNRPEYLADKNEKPGVAAYLKKLTDIKSRSAPAVESGWKILNENEIAHVEEKPGIGQRLTDVFNFESRLFTRIAKDLEGGSQGIAVKTFDEFTDMKPLEDAHVEHVRQGGKANPPSPARMLNKQVKP